MRGPEGGGFLRELAHAVTEAETREDTPSASRRSREAGGVALRDQRRERPCPRAGEDGRPSPRRERGGK